jgi:hypothetical protein
MCSINHDLKAIYIHLPKNGGLYVEDILTKYYGFKTLYFTRSDHKNFIDPIEGFDATKLINGFIKIRKQGIVRYFSTSSDHNEKTGMDQEKWNSYYKFTFVRNPYSKLVSAFKYLVQDETFHFEKFVENMDSLNNYVYTHAFISQYEHLLNEQNEIKLDFIGTFENLNEDLVTVLMNLGVNKIKHGDYINKNIIINGSKKKVDYITYYNENLIKIVNHLFEKDFEKFNYPKCNSIEELEKFKIKTRMANEDLYNKLKSEDRLDNSETIKIKLDEETEIDISNFNSETYNNVLYDSNYIIKNKSSFHLNNIKEMMKNLKPCKSQNLKNKKMNILTITNKKTGEIIEVNSKPESYI